MVTVSCSHTHLKNLVLEQNEVYITVFKVTETMKLRQCHKGKCHGSGKVYYAALKGNSGGITGGVLTLTL